jgi:dihydrofolate reductase
MSRVILDLSMSLDGFVAGPNVNVDNPLGDDGDRLHDWMFAGATDVGQRVQEEIFATAGAVVMGRRSFDVGKSHWDTDFDTFRRLPILVLTHRPHDPVVDPGGSTFTFVTDDVERTIEQARAIAGQSDVVLGGGASLGRQALRAGLVDELRLHLVHVLLGRGARLLDDPDSEVRHLRATRVLEDTGVTHFLLAWAEKPGERAGS